MASNTLETHLIYVIPIQLKTESFFTNTTRMASQLLTLSAFVNCNTSGSNSSIPPAPPDTFPPAGPAESECADPLPEAVDAILMNYKFVKFDVSESTVLDCLYPQRLLTKLLGEKFPVLSRPLITAN